ncbi:MAG: hypothetical protein J5625_00385 [Lachnospiraceae bacterium]|nr:hypothetical protein [Lachnospiraceae bacterium]
MEYVIVYVSPVFLLAIVTLICVLCEMIKPSSIEKGNKGKLGDSYSVYVFFSAGKGTPQYLETVFTKRKNGKYRLKFGFFEWIIMATCIIPIFGLYAFIICVILKMNDEILLETISCIVVVGLDLLIFSALMCNPTIRALVFFRKFQKGFQMK